MKLSSLDSELKRSYALCPECSSAIAWGLLELLLHRAPEDLAALVLKDLGVGPDPRFRGLDRTIGYPELVHRTEALIRLHDSHHLPGADAERTHDERVESREKFPREIVDFFLSAMKRTLSPEISKRLFAELPHELARHAA